MSSIKWIDEVNNNDVEIVGGKAASLGELKSANLPVPEAFVVTAETFRKYIDNTEISEKIFELLEKINVNNSKELNKASEKIKEIILNTDMPNSLKKEIKKAYKKISKEEKDEKAFVAVRSSATAEDLPDASFAGQQETFLNIKEDEKVIEAIKKCWASLYTGRAIFYREKQGFNHSDVNIAVIVQKMVDAEKAGVIFTSHPTTGKDEVIIEAGWGLGEGVVSGQVSPDHYIVDRKTYEITKTEISTKNKMFIKDKKTRETIEEEVPDDKKNARTLNEKEIKELSKLADTVENHYGTPQDVEWAIKDSEIFMLQSRPITTITGIEEEEESEDGEVLVEGLGAAPGKASGKVKIVQNLDEIDKIKKGDIMVTTMTTPDMVPSMKKASAIVTDEGGMTCHAAIVSRELGTPAVVGTKNATSVLKDRLSVTVDGERGKITKGKKKKEEKTEEKKDTEEKIVKTKSKEITATDIKVNVSIPEAATRAVETGADGVGLLRIEHMVLGLNRHPQSYIDSGEEEKFIEELFEGIGKVCEEFYPKPVWVRTLDAPTDEFRSLKGGEHEPKEHNPMLGMRGIRRDLQYPENFKLQIKAIKKLQNKGYDNIGIILPLVQDNSEISRSKQIIKETGLDINKLDFGVMIETPAAALIIDDILKEDIDFVSFGTNDLTQYTLAVDRNNENVSHIYNERHDAVIKLMEKVIKACNDKGVKTSICGQAGSYPDIVEKLVELGISSVSANIDAVNEIRNTVAKTEKKLLLDSIR